MFFIAKIIRQPETRAASRHSSLLPNIPNGPHFLAPGLTSRQSEKYVHGRFLRRSPGTDHIIKVEELTCRASKKDFV
jgi:hypothetical protein